jgi:hypothetical protein
VSRIVMLVEELCSGDPSINRRLLMFDKFISGFMTHIPWSGFCHEASRNRIANLARQRLNCLTPGSIPHSRSEGRGSFVGQGNLATIDRPITQVLPRVGGPLVRIMRVWSSPVSLRMSHIGPLHRLLLHRLLLHRLRPSVGFVVGCTCCCRVCPGYGPARIAL